MHFLRHRGGTGGDEEQEGCVAGCEAFLSGHWWAEYERDRGLVPTWAWLNLVAHCPDDQLDEQISAVRSLRWRQALAYLVCELRAAGKEQGRTVQDLQSSALVPLELQAMGARPWTAESPSALVVAVTEALTEGASLSHRQHWKWSAPRTTAKPDNQ
jgi:hypothetical protein